MRTPRDIARALGWPEARRREREPVRVEIPRSNYPFQEFGRTGDKPSPFLIVPGPPAIKLHVRKDRNDGCWSYDVWEGCRWHTGGHAPSQPAALALGLAALDTTRSH